MDLKQLEERYRYLENDCTKLLSFKQKAKDREDQLFWEIEIEDVKKEMKKVSIQFSSLATKDFPRAA